MKSFFKKIALVLVLAMAVTMLPAKAATAADAEGPQLSKQVKLYIGGDKSGSYSEAAYAKVWNKDGYTVEFSSSDETVATVGRRKGLVTAVSVGEAEITAVFTNESGETVTKTCPVVVKKNAVVAGISDASAKTLEEGIAVGETFQPKVFRTSADGETSWKGKDVITDGARFESSNTEIFTVKRTIGEITAVAPGEAILTVWAVQGEKPAEVDENGKVIEYLATTEKVEYPVKVVVNNPVITNVTLKSIDTLVLTVTGVTEDNVKELVVKNEVGAPITTMFKDPVLSEDGTTVTIEKYLNFINDEKLTLAFGEGEGYDYTVKIGEPAALIIEGPTVAVFSVATPIVYKVVDENGTDLEITDVAFEVSDQTHAYVDNTEKKITMYQLNATVTLKGTYNTGKTDPETWYPILKTDEITVVCVEASAVTASGTKFMLGNSYDESKLSNDMLAMNLRDVNSLRLFVQIALSDNSKVVSSTEGGNGFSFETLTPNVLLVDASTGLLAPVGTGIARIRVRYDNNGIINTAIAVIEVRPNPEEATVSVEYSGSTTISTSVNVDESVTATIKGKDQYGNDYPVEIDKVESVGSLPSGMSPEAAEALLEREGASLKLKGAGTEAGTYTYRVTTKGKHTVIISIIVKNPTTNDITKAVSYRVQLTNSGATKEIDPSKVTDATCGDVTFRVIGLDNNGVAIDVVGSDKVTITSIGGDNALLDTVTTTGTSEYVVKFASPASTVKGAAIVVSGTEGINVKTGSFVISADVKVNDAGTKRNAVPATISVSIKKNAPSYTIASAAVPSATVDNYLEKIMEQFTVGNKDPKYYEAGFEPYITDETNDKDYVSSITGIGTSYVLVKNIRVYEKVGNNYVLHTIGVNRYFSVTVVSR